MVRRLPPLKALRVFESAAQHLSFTKAADELYLTQSAVSKQIKLLEEYLQAPLFMRNNNNLKLTSNGQAFLLNIKSSLDLIEYASQKITHADDKKHLNIAVPPTFLQRWLLPRLQSFRAENPNININFCTIYDYKMLEKNMQNFDVIIFYGDGRLKDIPTTPLFSEEHISVCSSALLQGRTADMIDLNQENLIHLSRYSRAYILWERWLKVARIDVFSTKEGLWLDTFESIISATLQGYGFAIVDKNMVREELQTGQLVQWHPAKISLPFGYWLAKVERDYMGPHIDAFCNFIFQENQ